MKFIMVFHDGDWGICMLWWQSWGNSFDVCNKQYLLSPGKPKTGLKSRRKKNNVMARQIATLADVQNPDNPAKSVNDFKDRLVKLIPSEIITAYTTIFGLINGAGVNGNKTTLLLVVFVLLLVLTPFYLYYVSQVKKTAQIVFTAVAFAIWVSVIGSPFDSYHPLGFPLSFIGSIILIFYTLLIPFVYKG